MKLWYDACTGKHIRYGVAIAKRFRAAGYEVVLTTRKHPDTLSLARHLGEDPIIVGKYDPMSLYSRLEESSARTIQFSRMFKDNRPDLAIAHQSVELCRTAFGLGIPLILTADTPHARAVNRLTLPFANAVVVSEALSKRFLKTYCPQSIVQFKGVDEVAWIKDLKRTRAMELEKPLIVIRELETRATYAVGTVDVTLEMAKKLKPFGRILTLKRYSESSEFVDSAQIAGQADLVISAGGTIAREAALQGVPSIVVSEMGRTCVNTYLAQKGFPIFMSSPLRVVSIAKKYLGRRVNVDDKLAQFDNPISVIEETAENVLSA